MTSEPAELLLDTKLPCLDKGFLILHDYMGGDQRIVDAARTSYATGKKSMDDEKLIRYLLRHKHTTPFEQVKMTFVVKLPIFVARQWVRHRTASINEMSGRYSKFECEFYVPDESDVRYQSTTNKQGRSSDEVPPELRAEVLQLIMDEQTREYENYESLLDKGIARELSRINVGVSMYTQWYWTSDLWNIMNFLRLRMDGHAQKEIRVYADKMANCVAAVAPNAFSAFEDYILNSMTFTRQEVVVLSRMLKGLLSDHYIDYHSKESGLTGREKQELIDKLEFLRSR